jgi:hypothetical protein
MLYIWLNGLSLSARAKLCINTYYRLQRAGTSALERPEQRRQTNLELLDLPMDILDIRRYLHTSSINFPSPLPIVVLLSVLDTMTLLDTVESDTYMLRERQTFIDMLQSLGKRWRIASKYKQTQFLSSIIRD